MTAPAKALASGDMRLMQKAGLEADLTRLERLAAAHYDDQFAVRRSIQTGEREQASLERRIPALEADLARRVETRGEAFSFEGSRGVLAEREKAGAWLSSQARRVEKNREEGSWRLGRIGGFEILLEAAQTRFLDDGEPKIEYRLGRIETELTETRKARDEITARLPAYRARLGTPFRDQAALDEKKRALADLEADLAADADANAASEMGETPIAA